MTKERLIEIATVAIHGLIEDDEEQALTFLENELSMTGEELKFFGVEK